jgi:AcrR family transcriptional regulator
MPKNTFLNLNREKQNRIVEAAIDEFSSNPYEIASINQIVKNSDIAKGSFYQYFENKEDLYRYIIDICVNEKSEYIKTSLQRVDYMSTFDKLREVYKSMIRFAQDNEKYSSVLDHMYKIDDLKLRNEILESYVLVKTNVFNILVEAGVEEYELKSRIDIEFISTLLYDMSIFIKEYKEKKGHYFNYESKIDELVDVFEYGIKAKSRVNKNIEDRFY